MSSDAAELAIRKAWDAGDLAEAAAETIRRFGPEILGVLVAIHRDHDEAADAFSAFTERLWTSIGRFEWRCSMRTWAYVIARRASRDQRRGSRRREGRFTPLSACSEVSAVAARVRTETLTFLRTEARTDLVRLREELPTEDQLLLVLRVDRGLSWLDLARVFVDERDDRESSPDAVKREAARLRKRFQLVKDRLRALGKERGVFSE